MICTIGSLVKGNTKHHRWPIAVSLYITACSITSVLLGLFLSMAGHLLQLLTRMIFPQTASLSLSLPIVAAISAVAIAYAFSDIGVIKLPRPRLMHAVPLNWWRWWQPYGGALAYGAALGIGITTEIYFGAFYVLCLWCIAKGDLTYGAFLMGTYGFIRSSTLIPATRIVYNDKGGIKKGIGHMVHLLETSRLVMAIMLVLFGACMIGFLLSR